METNRKTVAIIVMGTIFLFLLVLLPGEAIYIYGGLSVKPGTLILLSMIVLVALIIPRAIVKFLEYERGVVLTLGKFNRIAGPGWTLIFPVVEKYFRVDLRLQTFTISPQEIVTKDKVRFLVSPEVFMNVTDPKDAILNVEDYKKAMLGYITSSLIHDCGGSTSDYIVTHMDEITHSLEERIAHIVNEPDKRWGIKILKIKLTLVRFPDRVQDAMHEKVASEQLKLAAHEKAAATKIEIDAIREAGGKLSDPAITYMYLEALDKIAKGRATKIVLPLEISSMAGTLSERLGEAAPPDELPLEIMEEYKEIIDRYDKRIKDVESKLVRKKKARG